MNRARTALSLLAFACVTSACASDWDSLRGGSPRDANVDAADANDDVSDAPEDRVDARADVVADARADVNDARADVTDASIDAGADVAPDVSMDVRADVVADVRADVSIDAPADVTVDVRPDVVADVPADVRSDVASDVVTPPRCHPTIDGAIGADWTSSAALASNTVATMWGVGMNELRSVRVCLDDTSLYLGVEGIVESTNAIVAFIDRDDGATTGVTTGAVLMDRAGALDNAISSHFAAFPAGVGVDMVWGTRGMSTHRGAVVDAVGLRDVRSNSADYGWIVGDETSCSAAAGGACEVAIPWTALYGSAGRPSGARLAIFLRLGNGDGSMASNQTLPQDGPTTPFMVTRVMRVETGP